MNRRRFLALGVGASTGLAGCAAQALPGAGLLGRDRRSADCPSVLSVDRTVCSGDEGALSVRQSSGTVSGDAWSLVVTVANRSTSRAGFDPGAWSLFRRRGDAWRAAVPQPTGWPRLELPPDDRYVWHLTPSVGGFDDADQLVYLHLDPGTYAFEVPFRLGERVAAAVTFDVTG